MPINRVNDETYNLSGVNALNNEKVEVILHFNSSKKSTPEVNYSVAKEAHRILFDEGGGDISKLSQFDLGNSSVKLNPYTNTKRIARKIGSYLTNMIHKDAEKSSNYGEFSVSLSTIEKIRSENLNPVEKDVVYAEEHLSDIANPKRPRFSDPFTKLAQLAFDRHERHYFIRNKIDPFQASTKIVVKNNSIHLVENNNSSLKERESNRQTLNEYRSFIIHEYGAPKISQIEHHFGISLEKMIENGDPLTPEIIYRMNMGALIFTKDDLNLLSENLAKLRNVLIDEKPSASHSMRDAIEYDIAYTHLLPLSHVRSIISLLDVNDAALQRLFDKQDTHMTTEEVHLLMQVLTPSLDEKQQAYTGKQTLSITRSDYTYGNKQSQKVWIDHQELQETFDQIAANDSWDFFYEKMGFVICKRNLLIKDKENGYKIDLLVPAPKSRDGIQHWLHVTGMVANGHGIVSYTLEPIVANDSIPAIKVFRSTAAANMHIESAASILNDANPLNGVGYEGKKRTVPYDKKFIEQRTIPVWVGYSLLADKAAESYDGSPEHLDNALLLIQKATAQRTSSEHKKLDSRSLSQIIRDSDDILNDLFYLAGNPSHNNQAFSDYRSFYRSRMISIAKDEHSEGAKVDGADLKQLLIKMRERITSPAQGTKIDELITALNDEVLTNNHDEKAEHEFQGLVDRFIEPIQMAIQRCRQAQKEGATELVKAGLRDAMELLNKEISEANESLETKLAQDIVFTGHSLGGAVAEIDLVDLSRSERMPLPGCMIMGYFLGDPKILESDNEQFLQFGASHTDLFKASGVRWRLKRIHEAGDPITTGGYGLHLGAVLSENERKRFSDWCENEYIVKTRIASAKDKSIRISRFVHETQFGEGIRKSFASQESGSDFEQVNVDPVVLGLYDSRRKSSNTKELDLDAISKTWDVNQIVASGLQEVPKWRAFDSVRRKLYKKRVEEQTFTNYRDRSGVFAVTHAGVVST